MAAQFAVFCKLTALGSKFCEVSPEKS